MNRFRRIRQRHGRPAAWMAAALCLLVGVTTPSQGRASKHTPQAWRRIVLQHPDPRFEGQRKHLGWNRDQNRNFIDDEIETRFGPGDLVDVVVELNDCVPVKQVVQRLGAVAPVTYVGRLVSCAYLRDVPFGRLDSLAAFPEVAMVEWHAPFRPAIGTVTRAVQALESGVYGPGEAARDKEGEGPAGEGIVIAVLDTGVENGLTTIPWSGSAEPGAFVAGFDATWFEDGVNHNLVDDSYEGLGDCSAGCSNEPGDGSTDPDPDGGLEEHGTLVAAVALARAQVLGDCRVPAGESGVTDCAGVAPKAKLVDVKVLKHVKSAVTESEDGDVMQGIDWVGLNHETHSIRVVNLSITDGLDCNGECAICEAVNYLAALGMVPIAALGNADCAERKDCDDVRTATLAGTREVASPAAASYAITVAGTNDGGSVDRSDDVEYSLYLIGPRKTPPSLTEDPYGNKPDIAAPAESIETIGLSGDYLEESGTSLAAPAVAGAASLLLGIDGTIDPKSMKDLLQRSADDTAIGGADWDEAFGAGFLDVLPAIKETAPTDVRFPSCSGPAGAPGAPCPLTSGLPPYLNLLDIQVAPEPILGEESTLTTQVLNDGDVRADGVVVTFGVYYFGTGTRVFHEIGSVRTNIEPGATATVSHAWTPEEEGHRCVQVRIRYPYDTIFGNNTTQRNLTIAASRYEMRVENPFMEPAEFTVVPASERAGWDCTVSDSTFILGGAEDCPRTIQIDFHAPRGSRYGERANCNVSVYARRVGAVQREFIGGATVQTYVPRPCRLIGQVVDTTGRPLRGVRLEFRRALAPGLLRGAWGDSRRARSDRDGVFDLSVFPDSHQDLRVTLRDVGDFTIPVKPRCGVGVLRLELGRGGLRVLP